MVTVFLPPKIFDFFIPFSPPPDLTLPSAMPSSVSMNDKHTHPVNMATINPFGIDGKSNRLLISPIVASITPLLSPL
jgi:hypothetical protein